MGVFKKWGFVMKAALLCVAFVTLSACATVGAPINTDAVNGFVKGQTTIAQAEAALGKPVSVTNAGGQTYLTYVYAHATATPFTSHSQGQSVMLVFDANGRFVSATNSSNALNAHAF